MYSSQSEFSLRQFRFWKVKGKKSLYLFNLFLTRLAFDTFNEFTTILVTSEITSLICDCLGHRNTFLRSWHQCTEKNNNKTNKKNGKPLKHFPSHTRQREYLLQIFFLFFFIRCKSTKENAFLPTLLICGRYSKFTCAPQ